VLASVLPGLRELRAPLAAGFLWLTVLWVILADEVPSSDEATGALERLYRLEPVISDLGRAAVASVAAYLVGSILIDLQGQLGRVAIRVDVLGGRFYQRVPITDAGYRIRNGLLEERGWPGFTRPRHEESAAEVEQRADERAPYVAESSRWIDRNREVLKTRMLDVSPTLHTEVDRPDAEATFRMALWPPLALLVIYLAVSASAAWFAAVLIPALLAWQWISLRQRANDALFAAIAARAELKDMFLNGVDRGVAERLSEDSAAAEETPLAARHSGPQ